MICGISFKGIGSGSTGTAGMPSATVAAGVGTAGTFASWAITETASRAIPSANVEIRIPVSLWLARTGPHMPTALRLKALLATGDPWANGGLA